jgi:hypothetical protein
MTRFPPKDVSALLRLDGLVIFVATLAAYHLLGGNWWVFALLILAPDLSMLGALAGKHAGTWAYNLAHVYAVPVCIGLIAWFAGGAGLIPYMLIWVAHIAIDRALGYGLKYPGSFHETHLGLTGKGRKLANAG